MNRWDPQHHVLFQYAIDEENLSANQKDIILNNSNKLIQRRRAAFPRILRVGDHFYHHSRPV